MMNDGMQILDEPAGKKSEKKHPDWKESIVCVSFHSKIQNLHAFVWLLP